MVLRIQTDALATVRVGVAVEFQPEAGLGAVGSDQSYLVLHVALLAVVDGLEVLAQSLLVLALAEQDIATLPKLVKRVLVR